MIGRRESQGIISRHTTSIRICSSNFMKRIYLLPVRNGQKNFCLMPANNLSKVSPTSLEETSSTEISNNLTSLSIAKTTSKSLTLVQPAQFTRKTVTLAAIWQSTTLVKSKIFVVLSTPHYYFPYGAISTEYPGIKKKFTK